MLVVISPAKKLNENSSLEVIPTKPIFSQNASELASIANNLSISELQNLMGISENLAKLNANRFTSFGKQKTMPAALAFAGDTYQGLNAHTFNKNDIEWAQDHLRIISGLYGLLRPLDKIEPYRLEMGSKLKTPNGNNLYDYWDKTISLAINKHSEDTNSKALVNCASQEYFQAIDLKALVPQIITPVFMEHRKGENKIISFFAKKARGLMARYIIKNKITKKDDLKNFNSDGYVFNRDLSSDNKLMFIRKSSS